MVSMTLKIVEVLKPADERLWFPFGDSLIMNDGFRHEWWNNGPVSSLSDAIFFKALEEGREVARIELSPLGNIDHYPTVDSVLGPNPIKISFFEVHHQCRGKGIGTSVIRLLEDFYPQARLVAFSENADKFWASLGWEKHLHPEGMPAYQPLFIRPA